MNWPLLAACADADPHIFFPDHGKGRDPYREARTYCNRCPVQRACLEHALEAESGLGRHSHLRFGMFGGATQDERAAMQWIWDEVA